MAGPSGGRASIRLCSSPRPSIAGSRDRERDSRLTASWIGGLTASLTLLRVTTFCTFVRGTPSSYTTAMTSVTSSFDGRSRTYSEILARVMSAEIIELWKLNDYADATTIDSNVSFTIPATSSSLSVTVSPVRLLETGHVVPRMM